MVKETTDVSAMLAGDGTVNETVNPTAEAEIVPPEGDKIRYSVRIWEKGKAEVQLGGEGKWVPMLTLIVSGLYDLVGDGSGFMGIGNYTPPEDDELLGVLMAIVHKSTPVGLFYLQMVSDAGVVEVDRVLNEIYEAGEVKWLRPPRDRSSVRRKAGYFSVDAD